MQVRVEPRRLFISFSGGETSAFMTRWLLTEGRHLYDEVVVVFANTGEEREETLEFVDQCDKAFGFGVVWVEAVVHSNERRSPTARIVSFETASRCGEPFEAGIRKYGIPNSKFKNCTRNLKLNPMRDYARSIGWVPGTYDTAIGIRIDELDRVLANHKAERLFYPLVSVVPRTKPQINHWWSQQAFRLRLTGYQGNCKTCWKKSNRKLLTLLQEDPRHFDFFARMERRYGLVGPEFKKIDAPGPDYRRTFFRGNRSVTDLRRELRAVGNTFVPASDENQVFDASLDLGGGCEESCEVFADEDDRTEKE